MSNLPRTYSEAILEVRYNIRLHWLQQRFYGRIRTAIAFITLLMSSAAIASALRNVPHGVAIIGLVLAALGFADLLGSFAEKIAANSVARRLYSELLARSATLDLVGVDTNLAHLGGDIEDGLESLRVIAWIDTLKSAGHEDGMRPESRFQRFMRACA